MRGLLRRLYNAVSTALGGKRFVEAVSTDADPIRSPGDPHNISILPEPPLRVVERTATLRRQRLLVDMIDPERARLNRIGRDQRWRSRHRWNVSHLTMEQLEKRVMLATDIWTGAGSNPFWS